MPRLVSAINSRLLSVSLIPAVSLCLAHLFLHLSHRLPFVSFTTLNTHSSFILSLPTENLPVSQILPTLPTELTLRTITDCVFWAPSVFTARRSYASAVLGVVILPVRPSVRLSHACFVTNPKNLPANFYTTWKGNPSSFLPPTVVGGRCPLPPLVDDGNDPPHPSKIAHVDRFPPVTSQQ